MNQLLDDNLNSLSDNIRRNSMDRDQRRVYEGVLSNTPDLVYAIGLDKRFTYANKALLDMWGCSFEDAIGKSLIELGYEQWHADMHNREIDEVIITKKAIKGEVPFTGTHGRRIYEYIFSPILGDDGEVTAIAGTTRDVTERKAMEEALAEAREHLSLMVESARDYAIVSMDIQGIIMSWNAGAKRVFGYTPEEAIGKHINIIFTPEDREHGVTEYELSIAAEKGKGHDERWHLRKDGSRFYASGTMTVMKDDKGLIRGFIKIARDMTYEKQIQEELIAARNSAEAANIAKTEFLANMSHEIRTPMNAVIGLANIIAISQPLTQKQKEYIKTLQMSADSLLTLLNDLLDIAKIETSSIELEQVPFSVVQLVQEVIDIMTIPAKEKKLTFELEQKCACIDRRNFIGDPTRLRQILLNLCSNAIKFTEKGSIQITILCEETDDPTKEIIIIAVKDTGIGIAPQKLETIFQKFVQADSSINRKYGGTGLGLAITKTLTEIMGGTIDVTSTVDKGSTFMVCLPFKVATNTDVAESSGKLSNILESSVIVDIKPRILLVEDYAPNVLVASTFLEQFGYEYDVASNGIEAIEKIKLSHYAAILMDVQMPGMNGLEVTHMIRAYEKQQGKQRLPIIGMTAHALSGDRERCILAGMDDYITKPFNPTELQKKIKEVIVS